MKYVNLQSVLALGLILAMPLVGFAADIIPENPPEGWSIMIVIVTPSEQVKGDSFKLSDIAAITVYDGDTVALDDSYFSKQPRIRKDNDILKDKIKSKELAGKLYAEARNLINNNFKLESDPDSKKKLKEQPLKGTLSIAISCAGREIKITFTLLDMKNIPDNLKKLYELYMDAASKIKKSNENTETPD